MFPKKKPVSKKGHAPDLHWLDEPEDHDYPAAESYLSLIYPEETVKTQINALRLAKVTRFKAKDIFRASSLSLLGISNDKVQKDRKKIKKEIPLSPLLLVRDTALGKVVIADGDHRLCAIYGFHEDTWIHAKII